MVLATSILRSCGIRHGVLKRWTLRFQIDYEKSKPLKVGRFAKQEDGSLILANDKDQGFMVNDAIIEFWNSCDGNKTINQLTDHFSTKLGMPRQQVEQEVVQL